MIGICRSMIGESAVRGAANCGAACCCAVVARVPGAGRAASRHQPRQDPAAADRDPAVCRRRRSRPGRARHRRRRRGRSASSGLFRPLDRAQLHPERRGRRDPALRRLAPDQCAGAGDRHGAAAGRRPPQGRVPAVGRLRRAAARRASPSRRRGRTGAASRISSPTRSTSGSPARTAISTPASSTSPNPGRRRSRVKRLAIMDQDGANHQYLTDGSALVLTPRFSPSAQQITYLSYAGRHAARLPVQRRYRPAGS